jgi:hypothetical protein
MTFGKPFPEGDKVIAILDKEVSLGKPKSKRERRMRQGFHSTAFCTRFVELYAGENGMDPEVVAAQAFEQYMNVMGEAGWIPKE